MASNLLFLFYLSVIVTLSQQSILSRADSVPLEVYYESLCPDSINFFKNQLSVTYPQLSGIMNVNLYPYGFASDSCTADGCCTFTCQHGPDECDGNKILACSQKFYENDSYVRFSICVMSDSYPPTAGQKCATELGLPYSDVLDCSQTCVGDELLHDIGVATTALNNPTMNYVPWITSNGVHTDEIQSQAEFNLTSFVCSEYQGTEPSSCSQLKVKE